MAYHSRNTTDLAKLGKETFDAIDNFFSSHGRKSKHPSAAATAPSPGVVCYHQYQPQQTYVVQQQVYEAPVTERVITSDEAAKMYGGRVIYSDEAAKMYGGRVINSDEAAKMYGGTVFADHPTRKPSRKSYFF